MMTNLFNIFDTNTNTIIELNWLTPIINLMFLPNSYYFLQSNLYIYFNMMLNLIYKEFNSIMYNKFNYLNMIFFTSMFFFILINNLMGLFPYIFTSSSHMIFSISMSLPLWLALALFSYFMNKDFMLAHMIPEGTPKFLSPFMVIIETISNIIRPSTLTIRLTANMVAGHLLLTLLSQSASSPFISIGIIFIQILLLILEFSVSIIQAYVFSILTILYTKEIT